VVLKIEDLDKLVDDPILCHQYLNDTMELLSILYTLGSEAQRSTIMFKIDSWKHDRRFCPSEAQSKIGE